MFKTLTNNKKMKKLYTAIALFTCLNLNAQIIYTDINDMVLVATPSPGTDYDLDVDGDSNGDFRVNMMGDISNGYGNFVGGSFSAMNGALKEAVWGDAMHLSFGDSIGVNAVTWTDFAAAVPVTIFAGNTSYGQEWLVPVTDGYFGFKFEISGNLHYGWMRMDVDDQTIGIVIKDWAYNSVPNQPIAAGTGGAVCTLTSSISGTSPTTNGGSDGTASVVDSGGQGVITYVWNNSETSASISGLAAGVYGVTVVDDIVAGCKSSESITLSDPVAVTCTLSSTVVTNDVSSNGGSDGSASVSISGDQGNITYIWSNSSTSSNATGLFAGTYSVTITDDVVAGCVDSLSIIISEPLSLFNSSTIENISIFPNPSTGEIRIVQKNISFDYVVIRDISGKEVLTKNLSQNTEIKLNTSKGVYLIEFIGAEDYHVSKLIIK
jgi:hypothetical protein